MKKQMKVFLGGTCNNSLWREALIPLLKVEYYNPVVKDWTPECQAEEIKQRKECDFCLYVLTPRMTGVFSVAEVTDDSNKRPLKTIFCFLPEDYFGLSKEEILVKKADGTLGFLPFQLKSMQAVANLVEGNGAKVCKNLHEIADYLNDK